MSVRGVAPGAPGTSPVGSNIYPAYAWAARPAAASYTGAIIRITDAGGGTGAVSGGNFFFSNGTRWKPVGGNIILDGVDTANSAAANTAENQLNPNHVVIPAGLIGDYDRLRIRASMSKNGAADTALLRIRFGPLGTVADPVLVSTNVMATTAVSNGFFMDFKRASATSLQNLGSGAPLAPYSGTSSTVAYATPVTVSSMDTTPMYLSITSQMTLGTEICTLQDYTLEFYPTDSA